MQQITILSHDQNDLIARVSQFLADNEIDLESITGRNFGEHSIVTVTVRQYEAALNVLQSYIDLQIICEDAIIVSVKDELGALARLTRRFSEAGIKIQSIRFIERYEGSALVAISAERTDEILNLIKDILIY